jgi:hypothetical protein
LVHRSLQLLLHLINPTNHETTLVSQLSNNEAQKKTTHTKKKPKPSTTKDLELPEIDLH